MATGHSWRRWYDSFARSSASQRDRNRSNSALGIKMCRSARFGLIRPRLIKRRTVMVETPPRYCAASLIFSAPIDAELLLCMAEIQPCNQLKKATSSELPLLLFSGSAALRFAKRQAQSFGHHIAEFPSPR